MISLLDITERMSRVGRACQKVELKPSLKPLPLSTEVRILIVWGFWTVPELLFKKKNFIPLLQELLRKSEAS